MNRLYRSLYRQGTGRAVTAVVLGVLSAGAAHAGTITGPTLDTADVAWSFSGVGFTATVDATLQSFTFENQGLADTVELVDSLGNVLDSVATSAGTPSDAVSVSWALTAGTQYYLLQSTAVNSLFAVGPYTPPSDSEIAMTTTGIFSDSPASGSFAINGDIEWAAFNNITTAPAGASPVAEPGSLALLLPGVAVIWWGARRKGLLKKPGRRAAAVRVEGFLLQTR